MRNWMICWWLITGLAWARPGMSASEARALAQQNLTYRQACQAPHDHVFEVLFLRPDRFQLQELHTEREASWVSDGKPGQALYLLPAALRGRVLQVQLEATVVRGELRFYTADEKGTPQEELLTYHVPAWEQDCDHPITHRLRVMGTQAILVSLSAQSKMRLRRLVLQALN